MIPARNQLQSLPVGASITGLIVMMSIVGCTTPPSMVLETLDPLTAVTVSSINTPFVLLREQPSTSADADEYIYLGPIKVNKAGQYDFYLWVGVWSAGRPIDLAAYRHDLEKIIVFADGEPFSLGVVGWTPAAIGTSEPAYLNPRAWGSDAYYQVTAEQVRQFSVANDIVLQISDASSDEFVLWDEQEVARADLAEFVKGTY